MVDANNNRKGIGTLFYVNDPNLKPYFVDPKNGDKYYQVQNDAKRWIVYVVNSHTKAYITQYPKQPAPAKVDQTTRKQFKWNEKTGKNDWWTEKWNETTKKWEKE